MDNINDIISSLSSDDIEMLKGVASSILSQQGEEKVENKANNNAQNNTDNSLGLSADDFNMIMKAKNIFDKMNKGTSKNAELINALKPHLSEHSRQKADQAIKMLRLFEVLPYLKDLF